VTLTSVSPVSGPQTGATVLQLQGTNFVSTGEIVVMWELGAATYNQTGTFVNATLINCTTPAFASLGNAVIRVLMNGQQVSASNLTFLVYGMCTS
jgi:hypothetical protein